MFNEWPRCESQARRLKVQKESPLCSHRQSTRLKHDKTERWPEPEKLLISSQSERLVVWYLQTVVMKCEEQITWFWCGSHVILTASFIMNELQGSWASSGHFIFTSFRCFLCLIVRSDPQPRHYWPPINNSTYQSHTQFFLFYFHFHPVGLF